VHHRKHSHLVTERLLVEQSAIALDEARFLQRPHPAKARRRRNADPARQFDIGHAAVTLQLLQDLPVDGIETIGHGTSRTA
jgi:hypothetical protein